MSGSAIFMMILCILTIPGGLLICLGIALKSKK